MKSMKVKEYRPIKGNRSAKEEQRRLKVKSMKRRM